jgi:hypothetical protein
MRWIIVLMVMISLLSAAAAQTIGYGQGYSTTQLSFLNGPNVPTFDTNVGKYWNSYVTNAQQNLSPVMSTPVTTMNIWMNNFPLGFSTPLSIKGTTFSQNATKMVVNPQESQSIFLRNDVISNFNIEQGWRYSPVNAPLSMTSMGNNTPPSKSAKGQIISQSITGLFGG